MAYPAGWDPSLVGAVGLTPWHGHAWRSHNRRYAATDPGGSLRVSGRYNRGLDRFAADQVWPALYLSCSPETSLGEIIRHVTPVSLATLSQYLLSELEVGLSAVLDGRDTARLELSPADLADDFDYRAPQALAAAAMAAGAEALLVPSVSGLGDNLIVFVAQLRPDSLIRHLASRSLSRLYVARTS